jgi:ribosomal protein S18 acetylase RimI-like enzyme
VQVASWRASLAGLVPDPVLEEIASEAAAAGFAEHWARSIDAPPTSMHKVHVAVEAPGAPEILGFAAAGPATDEDLWARTDGELYELHVLPTAGGAGHDERLLHAVADAFGEDGFHTAYAWALAGDTTRIKFLEAAGWALDGARSNLDMGVKVPVVRLHTRLSPER